MTRHRVRVLPGLSLRIRWGRAGNRRGPGHLSAFAEAELKMVNRPRYLQPVCADLAVNYEAVATLSLMHKLDLCQNVRRKGSAPNQLPSARDLDGLQTLESPAERNKLVWGPVAKQNPVCKAHQARWEGSRQHRPIA